MQIDFVCKKVLVYRDVVDFRKSIDGLCALVAEELGENPTDGLYVFCNRGRNRLKILGWHGNGFILLYKRLEKGRFFVEKSADKIAITKEQLLWLTSGFDWELMSDWEQEKVFNYC